MPDIDALIEALSDLEVPEAPLLTVSLDLEPGPDGIPSAGQVMKQGWRNIEERYPDGLADRDALRSYEADQAAVEQLHEEAIGRGAAGLFYAGCAARGIRRVLETPYPLRHHLALGHRPWLFELLRYRYLVHRPVTLVLADLGGIQAMRIQYGEVDEEIDIERWEGAATGPHGRTDTQGVGSPGRDAQGGAPDTAGGWHGKTRIEKSILAHREAFAREDAARVAELAGEEDLLVVAGADETRADLLHQLPERLRGRTVEAAHIDPRRSERELADMATEAAVSRQYAQASAAYRRWASGDLGERAIAGVEAVMKAVERGQLGTLIMAEAAVPHLGTAVDAREHEGTLTEDAVAAVVRGALSVSAECLVLRRDNNGDDGGAPEDVAGILRWT